MAKRFLPFEELREAIAERSFDRPPALVANAHITGLGVARALAAYDIPIIAIDRNGKGVASYSDVVDIAGQVTYPLDDYDGFREDVEALAAEVGTNLIGFACMDEWVHAFAGTAPEGIQLPFATDQIDAILDKESLYSTADKLNIPYPETYRISKTATDNDVGKTTLNTVTAEEAAERLGFPLVVKPAFKRKFEEVMGTNVIEVGNTEEYADVVATADNHDVRIMAQERVPIVAGEDRSYASYIPKRGEPIGIVGNPTRSPAVYGTSCLVKQTENTTIENCARSMLKNMDYYGISEAEFVFDGDRNEYVLLDVNTRPWKWISLPVQAGVNLPYAAYSDAVGIEYRPESIQNATWVHLRDYFELLSSGGTDQLSREQWASLINGSFEDQHNLTTSVYRPSDSTPAVQLVSTEFSESEYYCSC